MGTYLFARRRAGRQHTVAGRVPAVVRVRAPRGDELTAPFAPLGTTLESVNDGRALRVVTRDAFGRQLRYGGFCDERSVCVA